MTPRKTCSLQSYRIGALNCYQVLYLEQRRGSILPTELSAEFMLSSFFPFSYFLWPGIVRLIVSFIYTEIPWLQRMSISVFVDSLPLSVPEECSLKGVVLLFPPHMLDLVIKWPQDKLDQLTDLMGNKLFERICDLFSTRSANWSNSPWAVILLQRQEKNHI